MLLYYVHSQDKKSKGFTLIEMLTAIIIVGVLASIAAPNFIGLLNRNRVSQGLSEVEGAIRESQRLATRRGKTCSIQLTTASGSNISAINVTPNASGAFVGCLLTSRELPSDVTFSLSSGGAITLIDSSNTVDITFSGKGNPDDEKTIVVSHPNVGDDKCVEIKGLLGNILAGDYNSSTNACKAK